MITAAVVYIVVSILLIVASSLIFFRALQSLKSQASSQRKEVLPNSSGELKDREEIIAKLERQFRSSPSADL